MKNLSPQETEEIISVLKQRFEKHMHRHKEMNWQQVEEKLKASPENLWSVNEMERTGGEPDVTGFENGHYIFTDCSAESPKGRRSICYDHEALEARKENKPENSALQMAEDMGITILSEAQYRNLQLTDKLDTKTSSWILTPPEIRNLGGALFCDRRYNHVFTYHNGAESYYAARGFRGFVVI